MPVSDTAAACDVRVVLRHRRVRERPDLGRGQPLRGRGPRFCGSPCRSAWPPVAPIVAVALHVTRLNASAAAPAPSSWLANTPPPPVRRGSREGVLAGQRVQDVVDLVQDVLLPGGARPDRGSGALAGIAVGIEDGVQRSLDLVPLGVENAAQSRWRGLQRQQRRHVGAGLADGLRRVGDEPRALVASRAAAQQGPQREHAPRCRPRHCP